MLNTALVNNLAVRGRARAQRYSRHRVQVGTEERRAPGSDRLACFLAKNAHEPAQELLHKPESAIHLVLTGQNRSFLWPCAFSGSLGRWWTGCGQLFPQSGILLRKPINLSLQRGLLIRDQAALVAVRAALALADCTGAAVELEKAVRGGRQAVAPVPIFRSSRPRQGRGHKRHKNRFAHVSHGTACLRPK